MVQKYKTPDCSPWFSETLPGNKLQRTVLAGLGAGRKEGGRTQGGGCDRCEL